MDLKQILLVLHARTSADGAVGLAADLAKRHGASVEGVCLFDEPDVPIADGYAIGAAAVGEVLEHRQTNIHQITGPKEAAFRAAMAGRGMIEGWRIGEAGEWADDLVSRARFADLVVIAQAPQIGEMRGLTGALAFTSGAPVLVAPASTAAKPFDTIVVAWNGSREARRALDESLGFLKAAGRVYVVVIDDGSCAVTDADGKALLRRLARHGVAAEILRRRSEHGATGRALTTACDEVGADLLVMGAYSHSRAAEMILGGVTRTILERAAIPTLLAH